MKAMMLAFLATIVIAVGANAILNQSGFSSEDRYQGEAVRLN